MNKRPNELVTVKEVAKFLGISVSRTYELTQQGKIPYYKVGRLVRFDLNEVWEKMQETMKATSESEDDIFT